MLPLKESSKVQSEEHMLTRYGTCWQPATDNRQLPLLELTRALLSRH